MDIIYILLFIWISFLIGCYCGFKRKSNDAEIKELRQENKYLKRKKEDYKSRFDQAIDLVPKEYLMLDRFIVVPVKNKRYTNARVRGYVVRDLNMQKNDRFYRNKKVAEDVSRNMNNAENNRKNNYK